MVISSSLYALDDDFPISIGYIGGINMSLQWGEGSQEIDDNMASALNATKSPFWGAMCGLYFDFCLNAMFDLQFETLYSRKGKRYSFTTADTTGDKEYSALLRLEYIEIPVLLKFKLPLDLPMGINIMLGPDFAYMINARNILKDKNTREELTAGWLWDDANHFDLGGILGAGIEMKLGPGRLLFDIRYTLNIMDITGNDPDMFLGTDKILRNSGLNVLIGYGFE